METKNKKLLLGYVFATTGFVMLSLNVFSYFTDKEFSEMPVGIALLIFILGAVIISNNKNS